MLAPRIAMLLSCFAGASLASGQPAPPPAPESAVQVTGDCAELAERVDLAAKREPTKALQVEELIRAGKSQCAAGHIRSGLTRLRVALAALSSD